MKISSYICSDLLDRYENMMKDGFEEDQRVSAAYARKERQKLERLFSAKPLKGMKIISASVDS